MASGPCCSSRWPSSGGRRAPLATAPLRPAGAPLACARPPDPATLPSGPPPAADEPPSPRLRFDRPARRRGCGQPNLAPPAPSGPTISSLTPCTPSDRGPCRPPAVFDLAASRRLLRGQGDKLFQEGRHPWRRWWILTGVDGTYGSWSPSGIRRLRPPLQHEGEGLARIPTNVLNITTRKSPGAECENHVLFDSRPHIVLQGEQMIPSTERHACPPLRASCALVLAFRLLPSSLGCDG